MRLRVLVTMAAGAMVALAGTAAAQDGGAAPVGRTFDAVNGTTIQCPLPQPRAQEALDRQFETRPQDLDELSRQAEAFFSGDSEMAAAFRARQADFSGDSEMAAAFRARQAEQFATDWPFRCRYRDANADLAERNVKPRVVFMGDSITEGWVEADPSFFADNGFVGRGISGQSSPQMLARFWQDVVALKPQAVHIMAGTNDIGGATGPITEAEYIATVASMIDIAQANGIAVIVAAMPPMSRLLPRPDFDTRPVVPALNASLARLAEEKGTVFVDYFTPLKAPDNSFDPAYANDGVHPTRAGYAIIEPLAKDAIHAALAED